MKSIGVEAAVAEKGEFVRHPRMNGQPVDRSKMRDLLTLRHSRDKASG